MNRKSLCLVGGLFCTLACGTVRADDVRYYEENGVTYRETTTSVQKLIPHTTLQPQQSTQIQSRYTQDLQDSVRTYQVPVTEYQWEAHWEGRWNPFSQPYMTYKMVPRTRYETKTDVVKVPVTRHEYVSTPITTQVPVTTHKVAEEKHVSRVAIGTTGTDPLGRPVPNVAAVQGALTGSNISTASMQGTTPARLGGQSLADPPGDHSNDWQRPSSDDTMRR